MQPWHRWREPLAVMLLVALALMLAIRAVALGLAVASGGGVGYGAIPGGDDLLLLVAAAAVLWCTWPLGGADEEPAPSEHARALAVAGVLVVGATVLLWAAVAVATVVDLVTWPTPEIGWLLLGVEGVLRLAVPAAALIAVVLALRRTRGARLAQPDEDRPAVAAGSDVAAIAPPPDRLPAAWQADEATGAVWLTADDAAQGRPGLSWSNPPSAGATTDGPWAPAPAAAPGRAVTGAGDPGAGTRGAGEPGAGEPGRTAASRPAHPSAAAEDDDLR